MTPEEHVSKAGQGAGRFGNEPETSVVEVLNIVREIQHFDAVAGMLATLDIDKTWKAATEVERRVLIDEFIKEISVLPDYLT